jgi:mono/diheme cytochrome c family protein
LALAGASLLSQSAQDWPVLARVPESARLKPNPLAHDADAAAAGQKLFEQHCTQCHGAGGMGGRRGPPLSNAEMEHATPGQIFWILTNGVLHHGMPSWSKLPPPQRWQLVSFIESLNGR